MCQSVVHSFLEGGAGVGGGDSASGLDGSQERERGTARDRMVVRENCVTGCYMVDLVKVGGCGLIGGFIRKLVLWIAG